MFIDEKNEDVVIDALICKIKTLEGAIWYRDDEIARLKAEIAKSERKESDNETV